MPYSSVPQYDGGPDVWQPPKPKPPPVPNYGPPDPWQVAAGLAPPSGSQPAPPQNPSVPFPGFTPPTEFPPSREDTNPIPGQGATLPADTNQGGPGPQQTPAKPAPYDPTLDYLMGLKGSDMQKRKNAQDEAVKRRLLAFGSREMAEKMFGPNDPFVQMVSADPNSSTSWMAEANRRLNQTLSNTNSMLGNQYGIWNSSGRTEAFGNIGRDYTVDVANETRSIEDEFAQGDKDYSDAEADWMQKLFDARRSAWQAGASNSGF